MTRGYVMGVIFVNDVGVQPLDDHLRPTRYIRSYDVDAFDGRGHVEYTMDSGTALVFPTKAALYDAWMEQSTVRPLREDGEPNRPLTALTIEVIPVVEAPDVECSTGKTRYPTQRRAIRTAAGIAAQNGERRMRPYHCPYCGDWHLTTTGAP